MAYLKAKYQQEKDVTIQERIRQDVESLEYYIQQFTASQTKTFDFQMHLMVTADTKDQLDNKKLALRNYLDAIMQMCSLIREHRQIWQYSLRC